MGERALDARAGASFGPSAIVTPANFLTVGRLVAAPVLFALTVANGPSWANVALWAVVATSDGLDGWVARRYGTTRSGAFLDPLADKVAVLGAMVALAASGELWWLPVALIVTREATMSLYRVRAARRGRSVPARHSAKVKTLAQDVAVGLALIPPVASSYPGLVSAALWVAVVLTLVTGVEYVVAGSRPRREPAGTLPAGP